MAPHSTQIVFDKAATVFVFLIEQKSSIHEVQSVTPLLGQPVPLCITLGKSLSFSRNILFHTRRRLDKTSCSQSSPHIKIT